MVWILELIWRCNVFCLGRHKKLITMYCIEHEEGCKAEPCKNACPKCKGIVKVETNDNDDNTDK